ncbi:PAS domain-containing sensor histidine kinase [Tardiphaga sp. 862_B3_N4_1]|uniref:PAS domain-containing sensor histidine kinase n=1 Tax=Tardiphaga sp. 862_B3_N4_1 TaxID=3240764 RepID=UPI003F2757F8
MPIALVFAWSADEYSPALGVITAISLFGGRWQAIAAIAFAGTALVSIAHLAGMLHSDDLRAYLRIATLLTSALIVCWLVHNYRKATSTNRAEEEARLIVENMPGLGWSTDPSGNYRYVNQSVMDYVGAPQEDLNRIEGSDDFGWKIMVHPDHAEETVALWLRSLKTGVAFTSEVQLLRADGAYRWFRAVCHPSRDKNGDVIGWYGTSIDIDDQKQAENALRKSEQQLRLLIDTIPALVWSAAPDGAPSYFNKRLIDYTGVSLEKYIPADNEIERADGGDVLVHPDEKVELRKRWSQSVATGESFSFRHRLRRSDGVYRWVDARREPLHDDDGNIVQWYCINVDIDEEARAQDALRSTLDKLARASQAASLAEMSASIAHEVNQPLAVIVLNSHACQQWLSAEPPDLHRARITMERVIRDANSAVEIVNHTRALFQKRVLVKEPLSLNEVISEVLHMMKSEVGPGSVRFELDLAADLPLIEADRVQIQQVLVNLIRNGIDAMESTNAALRAISIRSTSDGTANVLIEIRDRGKGIENPEKVFEPFYTTRKSGMGMGLAISRSIVEGHQGRLWAEQRDDGGAIVSFVVPSYDASAQ